MAGEKERVSYHSLRHVEMYGDTLTILQSDLRETNIIVIAIIYHYISSIATSDGDYRAVSVVGPHVSLLTLTSQLAT